MYIPSDTKLDTEWFSFTASYTQSDPRTIVCSQEFAAKKRFVTQTEYTKFKEALQKAFYLLRAEIILKSTLAAEASVDTRKGTVVQ